MAKKKRQANSVGFVALGCPKNTVDSERMLAHIVQGGMLISEDPDQADAVVINTCGFIAPAKAESIGVIRHALDCKRQGKIRKVLVAGCLSQRMGEALLQEVPGIDAVIGLEQRDQIAEIILKTLKQDHPGIFLEPELTRKPHAINQDDTRLLIGPAHRAYVRISEGCDHKCSFCTIPAIRGPFRSKPEDQVVQEALELVNSGVKELNLVAQDTTSYERDLKVKDGLAHLLGRLDEIKDLPWIRLMYLYPTGVSDHLIKTLATGQRILKYLDIPIQHASDRILRAMRRPDKQSHLRGLIERLRLAMPDIILRTTVIVGFPGETDEEFEDLLSFIEWAQFDALGCFPYFQEPGTEAATLPGQIEESVKQERVEQLMMTQQAIAFAKNQQHVGRTLTCLVDDIEPDGTGIARYYGQAPEIDSVCLIANCRAEPGDFIQGHVTATQDYDLVCESL
ncbi:MAG: 30S ribosomal protein S12 methylthiotransferase RimO [Phycisphaeraceae bacterium]|nr:30S ribosomal protein S12 methylthiotransferase RimO [Phycisphaeraceae bacterium]